MKLWGPRRKRGGPTGWPKPLRRRWRAGSSRAARPAGHFAVWTAVGMLALVGGAVMVGDGSWPRWHFPSPLIRTIDLRGLERLSADEIRPLLSFQEGDRLFGVSLRAAAGRLSGHPWIARAALYRSLPGAVVVQIEERQPAAVVRDGELAWYVDRQGALLGPVGGRPGPSGLEVAGVSVARLRAGSPQERRRVQQGLTLLELVRRDGVDAAVVTLQRDDEVVVAFGGWRLHFRAGHYQEPWRRFWQVAERIPADSRHPREVDLRFANSVVVKM